MARVADAILMKLILHHAYGSGANVGLDVPSSGRSKAACR